MQHVPNALTISRILVTPVMLVLLMSDTLLGQSWAFGLFVFAAISDWLDGKVARTYKVRSRLGQFLDPFADKVLVLGTFVALAFLQPENVPWWAVLLIALRDGGVTAMRTWAEAHGRSLRTLQAARLKTLVQLIYLIFMLALLPLARLSGTFGEAARWTLDSTIPLIALAFVVLFTIITGVLYVMRQDYNEPAQSNG